MGIKPFAPPIFPTLPPDIFYPFLVGNGSPRAAQAAVAVAVAVAAAALALLA